MLVNSYNISKTLNAYNSKCHLWTYALLALSLQIQYRYSKDIMVYILEYDKPKVGIHFHVVSIMLVLVVSSKHVSSILGVIKTANQDFYQRYDK